MKKFNIIIGLFLSIFIFASCNISFMNAKNFEIIETSGTAIQDYLIIGDYSMKINGVIKNKADTQKTATIEITVYDKDEITLGNNSQKITLKGKESKEFIINVTCGVREPKTYKIKVK